MRITPYNFGKEDKTILTDNILNNILISHYRGIIRLIKYIYFNGEFKKNITIKFKFSDENNLYIYEDGEFKPLPNDYVLDTIIIDSWKILYNYYEKINISNFKKKLVCTQTLDRIQDFINSYDKICEGISEPMLIDIKTEIYSYIKLFYSKAYYKRKLLRKKAS